MKNKFKKSKIIVPALALITATTVASVTGTVAWFTASRVATVSASTFETKALEANLKVKSTQLVGTTTKDSDATANSTIEVDGTITHGSYNAAANNTGHLYVANFGDDSNVTSYSDKKTLSEAQANVTQPTADSHSCWWAGSYTEGATTKNIWYAVAWKMEFTTTHGVDDSMSLFVDYSSCTFTDNVENGDTIAGLRIALMTSTNVRVIGGEAETNHVKGETTNDVENFGTGIYHQTSESYTKATDKTDFSANVGYLGAMTKVGTDTSKTTSSLEVTAVAWFEGESTNVVSDKTMSKVTASLSFYARINAEA